MSITDFDTRLNIVGNACAVITAGFALWFFCTTESRKCRNRSEVEKYLKAEKDKAEDRGQRTVLHLVGALGMSQEEVWQACLKSKHVSRVRGQDGAGKTNTIFFFYDKNRQSKQ